MKEYDAVFSHPQIASAGFGEAEATPGNLKEPDFAHLKRSRYFGFPVEAKSI